MTARRRPVRDLFDRKNIRQALRHWGSSKPLGDQPLATLNIVERHRSAAGYRAAPSGRGVALREVLHAAIQHLKPDTGSEDFCDRRWRSFLILREQYLLGRLPDYVAEQMGVARSTYDHAQVEALEALADLLREWEQVGLPLSTGLVRATTPRQALEPAFNAPPRPPQPLVGREAQLAELRRRLTDRFAPPVVALSGLPGVGKTALAVELAHDPTLRSHFRDGVLWAGLGQRPDLPGLLSLWAVALGLPLDEMTRLDRLADRAQAVHAAIGTRRLLLVVDDVWKPEDGLALKVGGPNCAHLFTTRFPRVAAELAQGGALPIQELSLESGHSLLKQLVPGLASWEPDQARALVEAAGGLPLALVLVGGFLQREARSGQPHRLRRALERLSEAGGRLRIPRTTSPLEAQPSIDARAPMSLESVIGLSVEALDQPARSALHTLALFPPKPNTFSEEAGLVVSAETIECLDSLVDHGLVEVGGPGRYRLHRSISEYTRLHPTDQPASERMASYFCQWIESHREDRGLIEIEMHNLLAALEIAHALGMHTTLVRGVDALCTYLESAGAGDLAASLLAWAEVSARTAGDTPLLLATLSHLGRFSQRRADYAEAERRYGEGRELAMQSRDLAWQCTMLQGLGVTAMSRGEFDAAKALLEQGLALAESTGLRRETSGLLANLASLDMSRGHLASAEHRMRQALSLAREAGDRAKIRALLTNLGVSAARRGDWEMAEEHFEESLELAHAAGSRRDAASSLANLGALASDRGDPERAGRYLREAHELAQSLGDRAMVSQLLASLGALAIQQDQEERARELLEKGLTVAREIGHRENLVLLLINRAMLARKQGSYPAAESDLIEALALAEMVGHPRYLCIVSLEKGEVAFRRGSTDEAALAFEHALAQAKTIDQKVLEAQALYGLARTAASFGFPDQARNSAEECLAIYERLESPKADEVREFLAVVLGEAGPAA